MNLSDDKSASICLKGVFFGRHYPVPLSHLVLSRASRNWKSEISQVYIQNKTIGLVPEHLMARTHHSDCRLLAEKAVGLIWSWPIQHLQSAEKNPDGLEKITDGFDDGRSHSTHRTDSGHRARQTVRRPIIWLVCQGLNRYPRKPHAFHLNVFTNCKNKSV